MGESKGCIQHHEQSGGARDRCREHLSRPASSSRKGTVVERTGRRTRRTHPSAGGGDLHCKMPHVVCRDSHARVFGSKPCMRSYVGLHCFIAVCFPAVGEATCKSLQQIHLRLAVC